MVTWKEELQKNFNAKTAGKEISLLCFDIVDSTNLEAKRQADKGAADFTLVIADSQSAGRGRRGRSWESAKEENIYMSLLLKPEFAPDKASMVTLVMALATARAIRECTGLAAEIKWPNDIVIAGKKAVGILTELNLKGAFIDSLVCGVGINVNQEVFPEEIRQVATSLCIESGKRIDRQELVLRVMENFEKAYDSFGKAQNLETLMEEYNALLVNRDRQVCVLDPKGEFTAVARGINQRGELLVEKEDGSIEEVYAGEVSVRGIYGYV